MKTYERIESPYALEIEVTVEEVKDWEPVYGSRMGREPPRRHPINVTISMRDCDPAWVARLLAHMGKSDGWAPHSEFGPPALPAGPHEGVFEEDK
jgi:hypothetical protein